MATLKLTAAMLNDQINYGRCWIVVLVNEKVEKWYHEQAKQLRSTTAGREWFLRQARGGIWQHMHGMFESISDAQAPSTMGMVT